MVYTHPLTIRCNCRKCIAESASRLYDVIFKLYIFSISDSYNRLSDCEPHTHADSLAFERVQRAGLVPRPRGRREKWPGIHCWSMRAKPPTISCGIVYHRLRIVDLHSIAPRHVRLELIPRTRQGRRFPLRLNIACCVCWSRSTNLW